MKRLKNILIGLLCLTMMLPITLKNNVYAKIIRIDDWTVDTYYDMSAIEYIDVYTYSRGSTGNGSQNMNNRAWHVPGCDINVIDKDGNTVLTVVRDTISEENWNNGHYVLQQKYNNYVAEERATVDVSSLSGEYKIQVVSHPTKTLWSWAQPGDYSTGYWTSYTSGSCTFTKMEAYMQDAPTMAINGSGNLTHVNLI